MDKYYYDHKNCYLLPLFVRSLVNLFLSLVVIALIEYNLYISELCLLCLCLVSSLVVLPSLVSGNFKLIVPNMCRMFLY